MDYVALADSNDFVPVQDTTPCAEAVFPGAAPATPSAGTLGLVLLAGGVLALELRKALRRGLI